MTPISPPDLAPLVAAATKGPWRQHLVDDTTVIAADGSEICCTFPDGGTNDDADFDTDVEQLEANAALIALAPSLAAQRIADVAEIERLERENARYRAVLEGAEYPNIDNLLGQSVEFCRVVGEEVAKRTKTLTADRDRLGARVRELENIVQNIREICDVMSGQFDDPNCYGAGYDAGELSMASRVNEAITPSPAQPLAQAVGDGGQS